VWWWRRAVSVPKGQVFSTHGILQHAEPGSWRDHRFGLSKPRWDRLQGRAFWVTGAGTGYGRAIALALAAAGARTFITGRRIAKLEETRAEGRILGIDVEHCYPVVADITSEAELAVAVKSIARQTGQLCGLINSAALPQPDIGRYPLSELSIERWTELMQTNVTAQWLVTKAALPFLTSGDRTRVLFLTSEAGWADTQGFGPYNISKSAVNSLGVSFAAECKNKFPDKDVQINVLVPGEARTEMNQGSAESSYSIVSMVLTLLSHPAGGPNGHFFHRDGRHLTFGYSSAYMKDLLGSIN
jgi:NAD(P)-dependent dehydrogenase (short-subunit alcohol dehydrogenase family)